MFFDWENKSKVNFSEFQIALSQLRMTLTLDEMHWVFKFLDLNNDEFIDYSEFCWIMPEKWWGIDWFKSEAKPTSSVDKISRSKSI